MRFNILPDNKEITVLTRNIVIVAYILVSIVAIGFISVGSIVLQNNEILCDINPKACEEVKK